ncbi:MAG: MYG1 family protein [Verrucomicrobia bacterium]|nr:MYG1 family protein [Verrucomicrobiota bacterium]
MIRRSVGTHDGSFHADEVTACALLLLYNLVDRERVFRTRDLSKLAEYEYVCDVGGLYDPSKKRFDHHQSEYQGDFSSAGMVLFYLREEGIIDPAIYAYFDRSLVAGVDAHDNGRVSPEYGVCTFSQVISNFVPTEYDAPDAMQTAAFFQALDFTLGHLQRLLERYRVIQSYREKVAESMSKQERFLYFDEALPWMDCFFEMGGETHPALFVVMPSGGHWKVRGIPPSLEQRMQVRKMLPEKWAGLLDEDLKKVSGIPGAIFCHKGRFISVWESKEDALRALKTVLGET